MSPDPIEASASLADIATIVQRVRQSSIYRAAGANMVLWGVLVAAGDIMTPWAGRYAGLLWVGMIIIGLGLTFMLLRGARGTTASRLRLLAAFALFFGFGLMWSVVIGKFGPRELSAFWPMLFMFGYAMSGLWFGWAFSLLGTGVAALIVAGYLFAGASFPLYLAVINGGGLIACGLWMRRA